MGLIPAFSLFTLLLLFEIDVVQPGHSYRIYKHEDGEIGVVKYNIVLGSSETHK